MATPHRIIPLALCVLSVALGSCAPNQGVRRGSGDAPPTALRDEAFLAQHAATKGFSHGTPKSITVTPDGSAVLFLRSGPRSVVQDLFAVDTASGQERTLLTADQILGGKEENLTAEEKARRERMRMSSRGIASYALSKDGRRVLVPLSGRVFVVERMTGETKELRSGAGYPIDPRFSPDGTMVACVRDGDLYVTDIAAGTETRLTTKMSDTVTNGLAEFVAQEEMDRSRGFWWSPDSRSIAYEQADTAGMETFHIADPVNPDKAAQAAAYPRPGKANAMVKLGIIGVGGGETRWIDWDHAKYEYMASVTWADKAPLCVLLMNREQTEVVLVEADAATGTTRPLLSERDAAWVNLDPGIPRWLKDGSGFLWMSERAGAWQLELRNRDGSLARVLTAPDFGLVGLIGVNERQRVAFVRASADPTRTDVYMVPLDASTAGPVKLTKEPGRHGIVLSDDSDVAVWVLGLADGRSSWMVSGRGRESAPLFLRATREDPPWVPNLELATVGGKNFNCAVIRPRDFRGGAKYPVIVNVYGGPHAMTVHSTPQSYYLQQWIADQGFIVVLIDGRGTPGRGRDWERAIKNDLIGPALDDQVEGLRALGAKFPEMDLSRVGIYGWSFGGYFSAMAAMKRPDVYAAGCAGAPVCDWMDYDTCYTERYLGIL